MCPKWATVTHPATSRLVAVSFSERPRERGEEPRGKGRRIYFRNKSHSREVDESGFKGLVLHHLKQGQKFTTSSRAAGDHSKSDELHTTSCKAIILRSGSQWYGGRPTDVLIGTEKSRHVDESSVSGWSNNRFEGDRSNRCNRGSSSRYIHWKDKKKKNPP